MDARIKLLLATALIILIAIIPHPGSVFIAVMVGLIGLFSLLGRIPIGYLLLRSTVVLPFSGLAALSLALTTSQANSVWHWSYLTLTPESIHLALSLLLRAWLAVCLMILLVNVTPFDRLLKALCSFRVPGLIVLLLSFLYRYLYLLWDEAERMQRARNLRYFGGRKRRQIKLLGYMVSALFLRSYERAERVQKAMIIRGWSDESRASSIRAGSAALTFSDKFILSLGGLTILILWLIRHL